jgi:hypothetical protein
MPTTHLYCYEAARGAFRIPLSHPNVNDLRIAGEWLRTAVRVRDGEELRRALSHLWSGRPGATNTIIVMARMVSEAFDNRMIAIHEMAGEVDFCNREEFMALQSDAVRCVSEWAQRNGSNWGANTVLFQMHHAVLRSVARHAERSSRPLCLEGPDGDSGLNLYRDTTLYARPGAFEFPDRDCFWMTMTSDSVQIKNLFSNMVALVDAFGLVTFARVNPGREQLEFVCTMPIFTQGISVMLGDAAREVSDFASRIRALLTGLTVAPNSNTDIPSMVPSLLMRSFRKYADVHSGRMWHEDAYATKTFARKAGISARRWTAFGSGMGSTWPRFADIVRMMPVVRRGWQQRDVATVGQAHPLHPESAEARAARAAEARAAQQREEVERRRQREVELQAALRRVWDWNEIPEPVQQIMASDLRLNLSDPIEP